MMKMDLIRNNFLPNPSKHSQTFGITLPGMLPSISGTKLRHSGRLIKTQADLLRLITKFHRKMKLNRMMKTSLTRNNYLLRPFKHNQTFGTIQHGMPLSINGTKLRPSGRLIKMRVALLRCVIKGSLIMDQTRLSTTALTTIRTMDQTGLSTTGPTTTAIQTQARTHALTNWQRWFKITLTQTTCPVNGTTATAKTCTKIRQPRTAQDCPPDKSVLSSTKC